MNEAQIRKEIEFIKREGAKLLNDPVSRAAFLKKAGYKIDGNRIVPTRKPKGEHEKERIARIAFEARCKELNRSYKRLRKWVIAFAFTLTLLGFGSALWVAVK